MIDVKKSFKVLIYSRNIDSVYQVIKGAFVDLNIKISRNQDMYVGVCYGNAGKDKTRVIDVSYVDDNVWVHEYHRNSFYIYHNYVYKKHLMLNIELIVDVIYQTGTISTYDAISLILKEYLSSKDTLQSSKLLEIEKSNLYQSIVNNLINKYLVDPAIDRLVFDQVNFIIRNIEKLLEKIKLYSNDLFTLKDLTLKSFMNIQNYDSIN